MASSRYNSRLGRVACEFAHSFFLFSTTAQHDVLPTLKCMFVCACLYARCLFLLPLDLGSQVLQVLLGGFWSVPIVFVYRYLGCPNRSKAALLFELFLGSLQYWVQDNIFCLFDFLDFCLGLRQHRGEVLALYLRKYFVWSWMQRAPSFARSNGPTFIWAFGSSHWSKRSWLW